MENYPTSENEFFYKFRKYGLSVEKTDSGNFTYKLDDGSNNKNIISNNPLKEYASERVKEKIIVNKKNKEKYQRI